MLVSTESHYSILISLTYPWRVLLTEILSIVHPHSRLQHGGPFANALLFFHLDGPTTLRPRFRVAQLISQPTLRIKTSGDWSYGVSFTPLIYAIDHDVGHGL
jgi:hypothetical protein